SGSPDAARRGTADEGAEDEARLAAAGVGRRPARGPEVRPCPASWRAIVTALLAGGAIAAYETLRSTGRSVTVPGDRIGCVYSSRETGHRFIRSIQPGERVTIGKTDELVQLPTNDIVYNITSRNSSPEAPGHLLAYTKGQVALFVEGVLKFRFNTTGN